MTESGMWSDPLAITILKFLVGYSIVILFALGWLEIGWKKYRHRIGTKTWSAK